MSDTSPAVSDRDRPSPDLGRSWRAYVPTLSIHQSPLSRPQISPVIAMLAPTIFAGTRGSPGLRGEFEDEVD